MSGHKKEKQQNPVKEIDILKEGWQRTQADFENYKKRAEAEKTENLAFLKAEFIGKLTPVLDNFRRAFDHAPKDKISADWASGIKQIEKQLEDILASEGLIRIPANKGVPFDPNFHEAISCEENDLPKDIIISELESGWQFEGRTLKPSKVRVSRGK